MRFFWLGLSGKFQTLSLFGANRLNAGRLVVLHCGRDRWMDRRLDGELPSKSKTVWEGALGVNESGLWRIFEHKIILFLGWLADKLGSNQR